MTDKQIIIDDVDVSGCLFHSLTTMGYAGYNYCKCFECVCECHNDCYYKQLKRKEQECEELNKWLPIVTRLEEQFKSHEKAKSIGYKTYAEQVFTELDQLKQALTEIKEIAEACQTPSTCKDYCKFFDVCVDGGLPLILQKISEVLDE